MDLAELQELAEAAIHAKRIVQVDYVRQDDAVTTCRLMEPFDVAPFARSTSGKAMFWGWCLYHDRIEQKHPENILDFKITENEFNPAMREASFSSTPSYMIRRDW